MKNLHCVIVDDEPLALNLIKSYVDKTPYLVLEGAFSNGMQALECIKKGNIDLAFLDIQMPEFNGLELAHMIPDTTFTVFITAYEHYAIDGFKVQAIDYLLKPASYADFLSACERVLKRIETRNGNTEENKTRTLENIFVKADYKTISLHLQDILYIEGVKDYVKIHLDPNGNSCYIGSKTPHCIMTLQSMKSLEVFLPNPPFIRIHRSYIINLKMIKCIERQRVVFGSEYLPISDSYKEEFEKAIRSAAP